MLKYVTSRLARILTTSRIGNRYYSCTASYREECVFDRIELGGAGERIDEIKISESAQTQSPFTINTTVIVTDINVCVTKAKTTATATSS